jgi:hypothetical protein
MQRRHRHVTDWAIRSQWGGGWWPRGRGAARAVCACAALVGLLVVSGCGGGGASSITIPPAKGRPKLPPPDALVLAQQDGELAVALGLRPARGGAIHAMATVVAPDNTGKDDLAVAFRRGSVNRTARPCGSGCYSASLPGSGPRTIAVRVAERTLRFQLPAEWPAPDATALVRRATDDFKSLNSVRYRERLASSPRSSISTLWTQVAPDRVEYAVRGGAGGIVIGATRWDRTTPHGSWVKSATQPIPAPTPIWSSVGTNAHLLAKTMDGDVVSFLVRSIPAWFTVRFDRRLLPRSLEMTAAAHFMHHDYVSFNRPLQIRPPTGRGGSR